MVLQTNYAWGNDEDRNWRPKHFTTSEEMDDFRKRVWKIWEEVVNYIIDNKTKYDSDKDKHVPLNKKEKEEEKRKYLDICRSGVALRHHFRFPQNYNIHLSSI